MGLFFWRNYHYRPRFHTETRRAVESIPLSEIQSLIDQQTAILEWYISGETFLAFIVTSQGLKVWQSSAGDRDNLISFIENYREAYENNKNEWIRNLNSFLNELSKILHMDEILNLIPKSCERLIIIPHWFLHIIPLHCLPLKDGQFLGGDSVVVMAA